ncbi:MAG: hypothetical protein AAGE52_26270 [Myxococcota bacterium]
MRWLPLLLLAASCGGDLTELVLVLDTDLMVPSELELIDLRIEGPTGEPVVDTRVDFRREDAPTLPLSLGLVLDGSDPDPVVVTARGTTTTGTIERTIVTSFVRNSSRALPLRLQASCEGQVCDASMTCGDSGECESPDVPGDSLPAWTGEPSDFAFVP